MPLDKRVSFPLDDDYFSGGSNLTGPEGALEDIINQLWEDFSGGLPSYAAVSTQTDSELHLYADASAGNDLFDGLSVVSPKKSLSAVFALLPNVLRHDVAVHLNGTFSDFGEVDVTCRLADNALLVIDGGDQLTTVAGPFMATASTDESISMAGAGWTPDAFAGYFIEVLGGAQQGALFSIQGNTADTIIPCKKWCSFFMSKAL